HTATAVDPLIRIQKVSAFDVPRIDEGGGSPVVFLHEAPDHKNEWLGVIKALKHDYRCIAPDLPGFGI
ncbi:MAG: alpha/beta fold hydrolase, partial [Chloroflexota bacterium]